MKIKSSFTMIKKAILKKDLISKIICLLLMKIGLSNSQLQALEVRNKNYVYLKRKYFKYISRNEETLSDHNNNNCPKTVWMCWLQGEENAPLLVKRCIQNAKKYLSDWTVNVITKENMFSYVEFPQYIKTKWEKGIISNTNLSDMLRNELLIRYGGLWLDATVLLTGDLPKYVTEKPFFLYTHSNPDDITISYNSWLIFAENHNPVLMTVQRLMYEYWLNENSLREYFLWHLFVTLVKERDPLLFDDIYYVTDELPETLARVCYKTYDCNYWEELKKLSAVHKMSYKLYNADSNHESYYSKILSGEI